MTYIALAIAEARTQAVLMMILVARKALSSFNWEFIEHIGFRAFDVTLFAFMLQVSAEEHISRFLAMIEGFCRLPLFRGMAEAALVLLELAFKEVHVFLHMTLVTGVHEPYVTDIVLACGFIGSLRGVTLLAISLGVTAVQFKAGLAVIKSLRVDVHRVEVPTFMILMTIDTGFVIHETVEMHLCFHVLANFLMTFKTIFVGNATCRFMAFQTVVVGMFQFIVADDQRPGSQELVEETFKFHFGRILRQGRGCTQKKKGQDESELSHLTFPQIVPVLFLETTPKRQTCSQP